jgi:hypothetical protein
MGSAVKAKKPRIFLVLLAVCVVVSLDCVNEGGSMYAGEAVLLDAGEAEDCLDGNEEGGRDGHRNVGDEDGAGDVARAEDGEEVQG